MDVASSQGQASAGRASSATPRVRRRGITPLYSTLIIRLARETLQRRLVRFMRGEFGVCWGAGVAGPAFWTPFETPRGPTTDTSLGEHQRRAKIFESQRTNRTPKAKDNYVHITLRRPSGERPPSQPLQACCKATRQWQYAISAAPATSFYQHRC